jgi:dipeptide/tripeptide permease
MIPPAVLGALLLGIPAFMVAYIFLFWRRRPVFWFALALIVVGLGYLTSSGALNEIGAYVGDAFPGLAS